MPAPGRRYPKEVACDSRSGAGRRCHTRGPNRKGTRTGTHGLAVTHREVDAAQIQAGKTNLEYEGLASAVREALGLPHEGVTVSANNKIDFRYLAGNRPVTGFAPIAVDTKMRKGDH